MTDISWKDCYIEIETFLHFETNSNTLDAGYYFWTHDIVDEHPHCSPLDEIVLFEFVRFQHNELIDYAANKDRCHCKYNPEDERKMDFGIDEKPS